MNIKIIQEQIQELHEYYYNEFKDDMCSIEDAVDDIKFLIKLSRKLLAEHEALLDYTTSTFQIYPTPSDP